MLGFFFIGFCALTLSVATGGYFVYVLGMVAAVGLVAVLHYALWGRGLNVIAADERAAEEARERASADDKWHIEPDDHIRRPPGGG